LLKRWCFFFFLINGIIDLRCLKPYRAQSLICIRHNNQIFYDLYNWRFSRGLSQVGRLWSIKITNFPIHRLHYENRMCCIYCVHISDGYWKLRLQSPTWPFHRRLSSVHVRWWDVCSVWVLDPVRDVSINVINRTSVYCRAKNTFTRSRRSSKR